MEITFVKMSYYEPQDRIEIQWDPPGPLRWSDDPPSIAGKWYEWRVPSNAW